MASLMGDSSHYRFLKKNMLSLMQKDRSYKTNDLLQDFNTLVQKEISYLEIKSEKLRRILLKMEDENVVLKKQHPTKKIIYWSLV